MKDTVLPAFDVKKPYHISLTRGMKGTYSWDISVFSDDTEALLSTVKQLDIRLREEYGTVGE